MAGTSSGTRTTAAAPKVIICYNCKGEGHISRQCTQPKRKRDSTWFQDKMLLAQIQEQGHPLTEEERAFLADPGYDEAPIPQQASIEAKNYKEALTKAC